MITNFKIFENNNYPKVGDYVKISSVLFGNNTEYKLFLDSHIGKIIKIESDPDYPYRIQFDDKLPNAEYDNLTFCDTEIVAFASTKEELEIKLQAIKYNL